MCVVLLLSSESEEEGEVYWVMVRVTVAREMALRRNQDTPCYKGGNCERGGGRGRWEGGGSRYDLEDAVVVVGEGFVLGDC